MKYKIKYTIFLLFVLAYTVYAANITGYEYWFDNGYDLKVAQTVTPSINVEFADDISTATLPLGVHSFHIRFVNDSAQWSSVSSSLFIKRTALAVPGANSITACYYWFNNDFANKQAISLTSNATVEINQLISTASLPLGVHSFHCSFEDVNGIASSVTSYIFIKRAIASTGTNAITRCQYWFDNDFANKQVISLTSNATVEINQLISTASLPLGIHSFHCSFEDVNGVSSSVTSYLFIKRAVASTGTNTITRCQYWYDNDFANAAEISLTAGEIISVNELLSTTTSANGIHSVHIRFQDERGVWSSITSSLFKKLSLQAFAAKPDIVTCEYWYDNDFASRATISIVSDSIVNINEQLSVALPNGVHSLHIRFKDSNGVWSSVSSSLIRKMAVVSNSPNYIEGYRYWVDDSIQIATEVVLPTAINPLDLVAEIDMSQYSVDEHLFHMQFKDTRGVWSSITTDSISRESFLKANFSFTGGVGCDSVLVSFANTSLDADSIAWDFGDGTQTTELSPTHVYPATGNYTVQIIARDTILGVDSTYTVVIPVTVHQSPVIDLGIDRIICNYDSVLLAVPDMYQTYLWNGVAGDSSLFAKNGTHILQVIDMNTCVASDTLQIGFYTEPAVPVAIYQGDSLLVENMTTDLQWYMNSSPITDATDSVYKPTVNGDYHVVSASLEGCYEASSNVVNVILNSIFETGINNVKLYPIPAVETINFTHQLQGDYSLHIYDVQGQKLYQRKETETSGQINVSDLIKGVYVFVIEQNGQVVFMQRFIKK